MKEENIEEPSFQDIQKLIDADHRERLLKWFDFDHLPPDLQLMSREFALLAVGMIHNIDPGAERTVALRKLLESKDAAVRALRPTGRLESPFHPTTYER